MQSEGVCSQNSLNQIKNERKKAVIKEHTAIKSTVSIVRFNIIIYQTGTTEIKVSLLKYSFYFLK